MPVTPTTRARRGAGSRHAASFGAPDGLLGEVRRDARATRVRSGVGDLDELEGDAVRVVEVDPAPPGEHALVDHVGGGEELDARRLEIGLDRVDVVDAERDVHRAEVVLVHRAVARLAVRVLEQLEHVVADEQAALAQLARSGTPTPSASSSPENHGLGSLWNGKPSTPL